MKPSKESISNPLSTLIRPEAGAGRDGSSNDIAEKAPLDIPLLLRYHGGENIHPSALGEHVSHVEAGVATGPAPPHASGSFQGFVEKHLPETERTTRHWLTHGFNGDAESIDSLDCVGFLHPGYRRAWKAEITGLMLGTIPPSNEVIKERTDLLTRSVRRYLLQEDPRLEGLTPLLNGNHLRTWEFVWREMELELTTAIASPERALHVEYRKNTEVDLTKERSLR